MPPGDLRRVGNDSSISAATILESIRQEYPNPAKRIATLFSQEVIRDQVDLRPIPGGYSIFSYGNHQKSTNCQAAMIQITGEEHQGEAACLYCRKGKGVFRLCVSNPPHGFGACANCHYNGGGSQCSFRTHETSLGAGHVGQPQSSVAQQPPRRKRKRKGKSPDLGSENHAPEGETGYDSDPYEDYTNHRIPAPRFRSAASASANRGASASTVHQDAPPQRPIFPIIIYDSDPESPTTVKRERSVTPTANENNDPPSTSAAEAPNAASINTEAAFHLDENRLSMSAAPNFGFVTSPGPFAFHGLPSLNGAAYDIRTHTSFSEVIGDAPRDFPAPSKDNLKLKVESMRASAKMQSDLADSLQAELDDQLLGRGQAVAQPSSSSGGSGSNPSMRNRDPKELSFKIAEHRKYAKIHTDEANEIISRLINGSS